MNKWNLSIEPPSKLLPPSIQEVFIFVFFVWSWNVLLDNIWLLLCMQEVEENMESANVLIDRNP